MEQDLEEPNRCNYYQVKGQEYREQENPGGTAHPKFKDSRGFYVEEQEQEKEQEQEIDPESNPRPPEEEQRSRIDLLNTLYHKQHAS